ncbi:MAG: sulfatase [Opitutales bacterium]
MRTHTRSFVVVLLTVWATSLFADTKRLIVGEQAPNILFILCDDLGWMDLGYNGAQYHKTPNIDRLAQQSMVFNRAYARPTCSPSRASLFTGLNETNTGIYHVEGFFRVKPPEMNVKPPKSGHHYEEPITMLADALKTAGYRTGYVGKWHVTHDPTENGFDFNAGGWKQGGPKSYFSPYKNPALKNGPKGEYLPDRLAKESIDFIQSEAGEPFFLCYAPYSVHYPIQAQTDDIQRFNQGTKDHPQQLPEYAAMVYALDRAVGRVVDVLEEADMLKNTLIVFTSDNGQNGRVAPDINLRGCKGAVYEGGIRVPTFVHWAGMVPHGESEALIDIIDWYPTLIELAGVAPSHRLDGESLVPLFTGKVQRVRETLHMHVPVYNGSAGRPRIISPFFQSPATVSIHGPYKYIRNYEPDREDELYNLEKDIGEQNNILREHPEVALKMSQKMDAWILRNEAVLPEAQ